MMSVEELVLENRRLIEHEAEDLRVLIEWERKREINSGRHADYLRMTAAVDAQWRRYAASDPPSRRHQRRRFV